MKELLVKEGCKGELQKLSLADNRYLLHIIEQSKHVAVSSTVEKIETTSSQKEKKSCEAQEEFADCTILNDHRR